MVKHIVFWKVKDSNDKQKNIDRMIEMLTNLVGKIDGLVSVEMGYNFNASSDYDVVLYAALKNAAALKYYQNHPEHIKCKEFIGNITDSRVAADYFYEEEISQSRPFDDVPDAPNTDESEKAKTAAEKISSKAPEIEIVKPESKKPIIEVTKSVVEEVSNTEKSKPVTPVKNSAFKEKTNVFGKKKIDVQVTPLEQRSDIWTCPNCGKIMPNYVGTCGCGEPKPFEFEPPVTKNTENTSFAAQTERKTSDVPETKRDKIKESKSFFVKKKTNTSTPSQPLNPNTWLCPNCGKILPNYVGTCGCGEPKPFDFENSDSGYGQPDVSAANNTDKNIQNQNKVPPEKFSEFENIQPSIQGYNPQLTNSDNNAPENMGFIKSDYAPTKNTYENYNSDQSFTQPKDEDSSFSPLKFDNAPPPTPMRFSDELPESKNFINNSNHPDSFSSSGSTKPIGGSSATEQNTVKKTFKEEKKHRFGKKAKENEALRQAEEIVNNRKDIPNDGTWTCPNCGKTMPKYVGTCGCGEPQPFDF